jgi:Xaa-Pro aminopeptidase
MKMPQILTAAQTGVKSSKPRPSFSSMLGAFLSPFPSPSPSPRQYNSEPEPPNKKSSNSAHLHGYSSDICRTFLPPFPLPPHFPPYSPPLLKKLHIHSLILTAQSLSLTHLRPNVPASAVDISARNFLTTHGYGEAFFTHRIGHSIGIKAHESPYLHQGNNGTILREGMVFTSEPGVYLVGEFGVRTEDVVVVRGVGMEPEVLSGRRAVDAWDP